MRSLALGAIVFSNCSEKSSPFEGLGIWFHAPSKPAIIHALLLGPPRENQQRGKREDVMVT